MLNEEGNLDAFHDEVSRVFATRLPEIDWRVVFVDDGSRDRSWTLLTDMAKRHPNVRALRLNRNYGAHIAISAGIQCADADAIVVLAADLQDPPSVLPEFVARWHGGHKVVWGVRAMRQEAMHRTLLSRAFHLLVRRYALSGYPSQGTGSFCLIDGVVARNLRSMHEGFRTIFGLIAVQGYPAAEVPYTREERRHGHSGWSFHRLVRTAIDVFTSYSHLPVRVITWIGLLSCLLAMIGIGYQLVHYLAWGSEVRGWTMLFMTVCFFGGVQTLALGVLGEYVWRTFHEVKGRPLWFVEQATFPVELVRR